MATACMESGYMSVMNRLGISEIFAITSPEGVVAVGSGSAEAREECGVFVAEHFFHSGEEGGVEGNWMIRHLKIAVCSWWI